MGSPERKEAMRRLVVDADLDDMKFFYRLAKLRLEMLELEARTKLAPSNRVEFTNYKTGDLVRGVLVEFRKKNAIVQADCAGTRWSVPTTMLRKLGE